jgi:L-alanine-DL-glutamate epimerase-like enolase superfamily enzyme
VAMGFRAIKLRLGKEANPAGEVDRVRAVRQAVGPDIRILVDATESWDLPRATQTGRLLQAEGIAWLEDPVHHRDTAGLSHLAGILDIPVTAGEHLYAIKSPMTRSGHEDRADG